MKRSLSLNLALERSSSKSKRSESARGMQKLMTGQQDSGVRKYFKQNKTFLSHFFIGDGKDIPAYVEAPVTPGHEFSGRVVALGEGAGELHGVALGDLTVSEQIVPCKDCAYCKRGQYQMCVPHDVYGFHQVTQGAMADYLIYPKKALVHKVRKIFNIEE